MSSPDTLVLLNANIHDIQILLPSAMIAEIIDYQTTEPEQDNLPAWYLGLLTWRGLNLPLISLENMNHGAFFTQSPNLKIIVIHGCNQRDALPYWAFVCMDTPKMIRIDKDDLATSDLLADDEIGALRAISAEDEFLLLDIEKIEQQLVAAVKP